MSTGHHSRRRKNISRSPHYNERSVSPHRRYSSSRSPSTSPDNRKSSKTTCKKRQDTDYSNRHNSKTSSKFEFFITKDTCRDDDHRCPDKDRDYDSQHQSKFRREKNRKKKSNKGNRECRSHRDDNRDSNQSDDRSPVNLDPAFFNNQSPSNIILISGLALHISEYDVQQAIINCGLMPKDIRVIRKKDTGASRGFAFAEFASLREATRWMEMKQGVLMLQNNNRAIMQYSNKDPFQQSKTPASQATFDWFCIKCGAQNFKRRDSCYKCNASKMESEEGGSGRDEVCIYATKTIMLRNLDVLTTEDSVMTVLKSLIPDMVSLVSGVLIGRDPLTSTSRGICYLAFESTCDALSLYGALMSLQTLLVIDGKTAIVSYCKYHMSDVERAFSQMQFPTCSESKFYSMNDLNSLADYSASRYAKTSEEYQQYFQYYKMYFAQQTNEHLSITLNSNKQMNSTNNAAALAQNAIQQRKRNKSMYEHDCPIPVQIPNGIDGKKYPVPDVTKYHYDKNTGYYYDSVTGLYYDRNSQYYYNTVIQKYLYWDNEKLMYLQAPTTTETVNALPNTSTANAEISQPSCSKRPKVDKQDRVKVAKKIAKDMERWAKHLNHKKETNKALIVCEAQAQNNKTSPSAADIGFAVLEKNSTSISQRLNIFAKQKAESMFAEDLEATCGSSSETFSDKNEGEDRSEWLDWERLICFLCKRQFCSKEDLFRHKSISELHKNNLEFQLLLKRLKNMNNNYEKNSNTKITINYSVEIELKKDV